MGWLISLAVIIAWFCMSAYYDDKHASRYRNRVSSSQSDDESSDASVA